MSRPLALRSVVTNCGFPVALLLVAFASHSEPANSQAGQQNLQAGETRVTAPFFPINESAKLGRELLDSDLTQYSSTANFLRAKTLLDAGQAEKALALFPEKRNATAQEKFQRAFLLRTSKPAEAGAAFYSLAKTYPHISDRCSFFAGVAFDLASDEAKAAEAYRGVDADSLLHTESQRRLARALQKKNDLEGALTILRSLATKTAANDSLWEIASIQEIQGQRKAAAASFLRVWSELPMSPNADEALAKAKALSSEAEPTAEAKITRAEILMDAHRNREAIELLAPIVEKMEKAEKTEKPEKAAKIEKDLKENQKAPSASRNLLCRARFALGKSLRKQREHTKAIAQLENVVASCDENNEIWIKALYLAAGSAAIVQPEKAIRFYAAIAQERPEHAFADDSLFMEADLLARAGQTKQARIALQRLVKLYPASDYRAEGLFKLFWVDRKSAKPENALPFLERLEHDYASSDPVSAERAIYWRARTLAGIDRKDEAIQAYERLVLSYPNSFYSILARSRLTDLAPEKATNLAAQIATLPTPTPSKFLTGSLEGNKHLNAALELLRLGLSEQAEDELLAIDRGQLRASDSNALRLIVNLLGKFGNERTAHLIAKSEFRSELSGPVKSDTIALWRIAYPLAFRTSVEKRSQDASIDPDLLQALIREESALDPRVRSWAGAIGLCQLMIPTASQVARWLKLKGPITVDRLHDPDLNLQLGSRYLASLLKQFDGNAALSLAGYNAGPNAVNRWKGQQTGELDEFLEEIPLEETRNYVKRVLRSWSTYKILYGKPSAPTALAL